LEKFMAALCLRWPWIEWHDTGKIWLGSYNPCSEEDMNIFYATTTITLGNGGKTPLFGMLLG
jgi:hypothetical protein